MDATTSAPRAPQPGKYSALSNLVMQSVEGQKAASLALAEISGGQALPDALHDLLRAVLATNEPERLRAFCRTLQKRLEQRA